MSDVIYSVSDALKYAEPRPAEDAPRGDKKNYAERFSRSLSTAFANALRAGFPGIKPDPDGGGQESNARTAKGVKKLDVNYSTPELGLGLGVSIKTLNFRDGRTARYTKNYTRIDNELRAEAIDYHRRQPYAVMVGVIFLPADSVDDGKGSDPISSFGGAVKIFRHRAGRVEPDQEPELFELVLIGLYQHDGDSAGDVAFFDVMTPPPKNRKPDSDSLLSFEGAVAAITAVYDQRNNPAFIWADD